MSTVVDFALAVELIDFVNASTLLGKLTLDAFITGVRPRDLINDLVADKAYYCCLYLTLREYLSFATIHLTQYLNTNASQ